MGKIFEERKLDIDLYIDGFNHEQIDCVNMPFAGATGFYNRNNYFYYSFYTSLFNNCLDNDNWDDYQTQFLLKLGLKMNKYQIKNVPELFSFIEKSIDNSIPLVCVVKYNSLFYFASYLDEMNIHSHGIIINGYDVERPLFYIRDVKVVDRNRNPAIKEIINAEPLFEIQLTNDMLAEIWERSNKSYKKEKSILYNTIFAIHKYGQSEINCYKDLIKNIKGYKLKSSKLIKSINNDDYIEELKNNKFSVDLFRRIYYHNLIPFFFVLEKSVENNKQLMSKVNDFKTKYIKFRNKIISVVMKTIYKNGKLNKTLKLTLIQDIENIDKELNLLIHNIV